MLRKYLGVWAIASCSVAVAATPTPTPTPTRTPYDMRGAQLGMTLDEFKSLPIPTDTDDVSRHDPEVRCTEIANGNHCEWLASSSFSKSKLQMFTRIGDGGGRATFLFTRAADGQVRLRRIDVQSNMEYFDGMLSPMMEKFGKPVIRTAKVQNGFGAEFEKFTYTWKNAVSRIELETRCGQVNFLCLTYKHDALEAAEQARVKQLKGDAVTKL